jgi:superfamily II RNA helicase
MLFNGVFNDLSVAQCVALCSCFVINENVKEELPKLTQELAGPFKIMQARNDFTKKKERFKNYFIYLFFDESLFS